jgi:hypothetical protein
MPAPPLTHHDILRLVEPFARRGRHVDLACSDRLARRLVFKPVQHAARSPDGPGLRETLTLECLTHGNFRLTRLLVCTSLGTNPWPGDGSLNVDAAQHATLGPRTSAPQATLRATGADIAELLARIDSVDIHQHFVCAAADAFIIARSYEFEAPAEGGPAGAAPVLSRGVVHVDGLVLSFDVPEIRGGAAELVLDAPETARPALPDDVLAVLGWDWARLVPHELGWASRLRLRGGRARRGATTERALMKAGAHLSRLLAEPPARFHERHAWARWGVVLRRSIPTLTAAGLIFGAYLLTRGPPSESAGIFMALHYVPVALLGLSLCLQELPRFEIPPWPRRSRAAAWRTQAPETPRQTDPCSATR